MTSIGRRATVRRAPLVYETLSLSSSVLFLPLSALSSTLRCTPNFLIRLSQFVRADTDSDFAVKPFKEIEQFVRGEVEPSSHSMCLWFFLLMLCQIIGVLDDRK